MRSLVPFTQPQKPPDQHTLKEVARACGYASLNYFCRQFRQELGTSPGRWRSG